MSRYGLGIGALVAILASCGEPAADVEATLAEATDAGRVCGDLSYEDVEDGTATEQEWATAVGMMRWDSTVGDGLATEARCSGALVAPNLFLTAGGCLDVAYWDVPSGIT